MLSLALNLVATARRIPKKASGTTDGDMMSDEHLDATSSAVSRTVCPEGHRDGGSRSV